MGAAAAVLPIIAAVAGPAISWYQQKQYDKQLDRNLARGIQKRARHQDEANAKVAATIAKTAASNPNDEREQMLAGYKQQLMANQGQAEGGLLSTPGGSDTYAKDLLNAALGIQSQGLKTADSFSRIDSPWAQRRGEAQDVAKLGSELDLISTHAKSDDYLQELKRQRIRKNPWLSALAGIANGIASGKGAIPGMFAGMGGGATPASVGAGANVPGSIFTGDIDPASVFAGLG